jgi:uroporphyrinogen-III synthase
MKRIWVTRDEEPGGELASALRAAGLEPILEPVLERRIVGDASETLRALGHRDWLVLTSPFAIGAIAPPLVRCRVAVVGEASRRAAESRGLRVDLTSPDGTGEGLWRALRECTPNGARIFYPRSALARPREGWTGVEVSSPILYDTVPRPFDPSIAGRTDAVSLTSPSAVRAIATLPDLPRCASIGPTTSASLRAAGLRVWVESPNPDFRTFAQVLAQALGN